MLGKTDRSANKLFWWQAKEVVPSYTVIEALTAVTRLGYVGSLMHFRIIHRNICIPIYYVHDDWISVFQIWLCQWT